MRRFIPLLLVFSLSLLTVLATGNIAESSDSIVQIQPCYPSAPSGKEYKFTPLSSQGSQNLTYHLVLVQEVAEPQYPWDTLIVTSSNGQCNNLLPYRQGASGITRFVPLAVAQKMALDRYRYLASTEIGKTYIKRLLADSSTAPAGAPVDMDMDKLELAPEDAWALQQLGYAIPTTAKILPVAEPSIENEIRMLNPSLDAGYIFMDVEKKLALLGSAVKLPAYIPMYNTNDKNRRGFDGSAYNLYATATGFSSSSYSIILGVIEDCQGGNACRYGTVTGAALKGLPSLDAVLKEATEGYNRARFKPVPEAPQRVSLANGIPGIFIPSTCGANCSDTEVVWDQNGFRYSAGIKVGLKDSVIEMANSAITGK